MTKRPKPWEVPGYTFQVPGWPPRFESQFNPSPEEQARREAGRKNAAHHALALAEGRVAASCFDVKPTQGDSRAVIPHPHQ